MPWSRGKLRAAGGTCDSPKHDAWGHSGISVGALFFFGTLASLCRARPRLRRFATAVDKEGWRVVALLRFASPVPNAVQNYLFGLTRIGFLPFALTTFMFSIPQVLLYVYLGSAGRAVLMDESLSTLNRVLLGVGLTSIFVAALLIVHRIRRDADRTQMAGH